MAYIVSLEAFEGPLDLLLHLIQKNKIDIYNIPIAQVTEQYLNYLQAMKELDLEIASEFLLMAATLLSIKAKMLLPQRTSQEEVEEEESDPRQELVDRLIEYQKYKQAAEKFKLKLAKQALMHSRPLDPYYMDTVLKNLNPLEHVSPDKLRRLLKVLLAEVAKEEEVKEIKKNVVTVKDKMDYLVKLLAQEPEGIIFQNLFLEHTSNLTKVVTFLALLELIHLNKVLFVQTSNFGPLRIYPKTVQSGELHAI